RLAEGDPRVRVLHLSRNFGHQTAITAGLDHAAGDAVVMIDADLQDPPEAIPTLLERWRAGADVVYAVREQREGETRFKLTTARYAGDTKYTLGKMVRFALDAMASFSHAPLQAATILGFIFSFVAFLAIPVVIGLKLVDAYLPGFSTITVVILLLGGIQLIAVG